MQSMWQKDAYLLNKVILKWRYGENKRLFLPMYYSDYIVLPKTNAKEFMLKYFIKSYLYLLGTSNVMKYLSCKAV